MPGAGPPSPLAPSRPSLVVSPAALELEEGSSAGQQLLVRLSAPPPPGERLTVTAAVVGSAGGSGLPAQAPGAAAGAAAGVSVSPQQLSFDAASWEQPQPLLVASPGDDGLAAPPAAFQVILQLRPGSSGTEDDSGGGSSAVWDELAVPARRVDAEAPPGSTPQQSILLQSGSQQLDQAAAGVLLGGSAAAPVALGQALEGLAAAAGPAQLGSMAFFNVTTSLSLNASVCACSPDAPLQLAVFAEGAATW